MYDLRRRHITSASMLHRWWRICARVLAVNLPVRIVRRFKVRSLPAWLAPAPVLSIRAIVFIVLTRVLNTIHALVTTSKVVFVTALTRSASSASSRSFIMPGQRISSRKTPATLITCMRSFPGVKFSVPLQVMQTSEARVARLTNVRLLLAVCQKMTLEVVVSCDCLLYTSPSPRDS